MNKGILFKLFFLALMLRLVPVLLAPNLPIALDDMFQYDMLAKSLATDNGFRWYAEDDLDLLSKYLPIDWVAGQDYPPNGVETSFRAPAYPYFLSIIYRIFGFENRHFNARVIQTFLGALLAPLTYLISLQIFHDKEKIAKIAGFILATYPMIIFYPLALATENLFFLLFNISFYLILLSVNGKSLHLFWMAGIAFGIAALTRSIILSVVPLLVLWWIWRKIRLKNIILFLITLTIVIAPWIVRNYRLHDRFVMIESSLGYNLYLGYHPESNGSFKYGPSLDLLPYLDDMERSEKGMEGFKSFVAENPTRVLELIVHKFQAFFGLERKSIAYFYSNNIFGFIPQPMLILISLILIIPFALITLLTFFSLPFMKWDNFKFEICAIFFIAYLIPHLIILAEPRFHLVLIPIIAIFASNSISSVGTKISETHFSKYRGNLIIGSLLITIFIIMWGNGLSLDKEKISILFSPNGNQSWMSYE